MSPQLDAISSPSDVKTKNGFQLNSRSKNFKVLENLPEIKSINSVFLVMKIVL